MSACSRRRCTRAWSYKARATLARSLCGCSLGGSFINLCRSWLLMVNKGLFYLPRDTIRVIYDDSPDYSEYGANKFMVLLLRMHPLGFTPEEGLASFINDLGAPQQNFFELLAEDGWLVRAQGKYYVDTGPLEMELDFYTLEHILRTYLEYR